VGGRGYEAALRQPRAVHRQRGRGPAALPGRCQHRDYLSREGIFIDQRGRYLGEVILGNRLMYNTRSPHRRVGFAVLGAYGSSGRFGDPGNAGRVGPVAGYRDVPPERLGP